MYVMGQMRVARSFAFLVARMNDESEYPIVRHEAGEALANYHHMKDQCIAEMEKHYNSEISVLKSTVRVGIEKLKSFSENSKFGKKYGSTIEPAEPFDREEVIQYLQSIGMNIADAVEDDLLVKKIQSQLLRPYEQIDEHPKYRMVYYLRDQATDAAVDVRINLFSTNLMILGFS